MGSDLLNPACDLHTTRPAPSEDTGAFKHPTCGSSFSGRKAKSLKTQLTLICQSGSSVFPRGEAFPCGKLSAHYSC